MDPLEWIARAPLPKLARCRIPRDLSEVTRIGEEASPRQVGTTRADIDRLWGRVEALYRTGVYPGLQICVRRRGHIVLNRALGHATGNAPGDSPATPKTAMEVDTPANIFSASKAVTAMVIHKLDEQRVLHVDDRVCDYIPDFARHGKSRISIRHVLAHRAGIPNLPPEAIDLELLAHPERVSRLLCDARVQTRPGRMLAYHAITGGFVLAEVVRRATGKSIRQVLREEIAEPLGLRWLSYGVAPGEVDRVARSAFTGPPVPPPLSRLLTRALGVGLDEVTELCNDPRFLTGIIPSANVMTTAEELTAFYQCLLDEGEYQGVRVFDQKTVRRATAEDSIWELDLTLGMPLRYGLGFMLGGKRFSLFGSDNEHAFGHVGFTNNFSWADPERQIAVALITTGTPVISLHAVRLVQLLGGVNETFQKIAAPREEKTGARTRRAQPLRPVRPSASTNAKAPKAQARAPE
jgi:CubicO group peptidase (beta-lactamase class C family)